MSVFATAKTKQVKPKLKKKETEEIYLEDLDTFASIDALINTLKAVKDTYGESVKRQMMNHFVDVTLDLQEKPSNFKGVGDISEASCQLKKKSSTSPLSAADIAILKKYKVSVKKEVVSPAQEESYQFSEEVMELIESKPRIAKKISDALLSIPELRKIEVLEKVPASEEVSIECVDDRTFDDIAKLKDSDAVKTCYNIVSVLAVNAKVITESMDIVLKQIARAGISLNEGKKKTK